MDKELIIKGNNAIGRLMQASYYQCFNKSTDYKPYWATKFPTAQACEEAINEDNKQVAGAADNFVAYLRAPNYYKSYDMLMPAIEKIQTEYRKKAYLRENSSDDIAGGNFTTIRVYDTKIHADYYWNGSNLAEYIEKGNADNKREGNNRMWKLATSKQEALWLCAVDFALWLYPDGDKMTFEEEQEGIRFNNMLLTHWTGYCYESPYKSIGSISHYIHVYGGSVGVASTIRIGDSEVEFLKSKIADFTFDDTLQMPIFKFVDAYSSVAEQQDIYLRHIKRVYTGDELMSKGYNNIDLRVIEYPISDRHCKKGEIVRLNKEQVQSQGAWFDFDNRWRVQIA